MEAYCTLGAGAGFGKYTHEVSQVRRVAGADLSGVPASYTMYDACVMFALSSLAAGEHDVRRTTTAVVRAWYVDERSAAEWFDVGGEG